MFRYRVQVPNLTEDLATVDGRLKTVGAVELNKEEKSLIQWAWYEVVNLITAWIFISRPFTWESKPDKKQRFIW